MSREKWEKWLKWYGTDGGSFYYGDAGEDLEGIRWASRRLELLEKAIRKVEWSSYRRGQGSGFMGSGGDGRMVSSCPVCAGINPNDPGKLEFIDSSHGHRKKCLIETALRALEGAD